jgi:hypothetical protein
MEQLAVPSPPPRPDRRVTMLGAAKIQLHVLQYTREQVDPCDVTVTSPVLDHAFVTIQKTEANKAKVKTSLCFTNYCALT